MIKNTDLSPIWDDFIQELGKKQPKRTQKDVDCLVLTAKEGDEASKQALWELTLLYILKNLRSNHKLFRASYYDKAMKLDLEPLMTLEDALAESWNSLLKALDKWEVNRGHRNFQTFYLKRLELDLYVICRREAHNRNKHRATFISLDDLATLEEQG